MTLIDLLSELSRRRVQLSASGDRLRITGPPGALTPALREQLSEHKQALIDALHQVDTARRRNSMTIPRLPRGHPLRVSIGQQRLWLKERLRPGCPSYNVPATLRIKGPLVIAALESGLNALIDRHEALRTTFIDQRGLPMQVIKTSLFLPLKVTDLEYLPPEEQKSAVDAILAEDWNTSFDIVEGPLVRYRLLRIQSEEHILLLTMHHLVTDGWSLDILVREMAAIYEAIVEGRRANLTELNYQYADYADWDRRRVEEKWTPQRSLSWAEPLRCAARRLKIRPSEPACATAMGCGHNQNDAAKISDAGGNLQVEFTPSLWEEMKSFVARERVTLFSLATATLEILLSTYNRERVICVGVNFANRDPMFNAGIVGFFINTVPIVTDLSGDIDLRTAVRRVHDALLDAREFEDVPVDRIIPMIAPERGADESPLFNIVISRQAFPLLSLRAAGLVFERMVVSSASAPFDLSLHLWEGDVAGHAALRYSRQALDDAGANLMARRYLNVVRAIMKSPQRRLESIKELLLESESEQSHSYAEARFRELASKQASKRVEIEAPQQPASSALSRTRPSARHFISLSDRELVCQKTLRGHLPLVLSPKLADINLVEWAGANRESLGSLLVRHGAIVFRGFMLGDRAGTLAQFIEALGSPPINYIERSSPRTYIEQGIYTSTEHPPDQAIFLHNEQSYNLIFPRFICFLCVQPALLGGQTPLADCRRVYARLKPEVRERIESREYLLVRNMRRELGLDWPTVFQTADKSEVERYCRDNAIEYKWVSDDWLCTSQRRPVSAYHPVSGEPVWFNHAVFFHISTLEADVRKAFCEGVGPAELPNNTYYGDAEEFEPEVLDHIRWAYKQEMITFQWQADDLLLIDNMLTAHGRFAYTGNRKMLCGMSSRTSWADVRRH